MTIFLSRFMFQGVIICLEHNSPSEDSREALSGRDLVSAQTGEQGALYAITRRITNSRFKRNVPVRSKEGVRITLKLAKLRDGSNTLRKC